MTHSRTSTHVALEMDRPVTTETPFRPLRPDQKPNRLYSGINIVYCIGNLLALTAKIMQFLKAVVYDEWARTIIYDDDGLRNNPSNIHDIHKFIKQERTILFYAMTAGSLSVLLGILAYRTIRAKKTKQALKINSSHPLVEMGEQYYGFVSSQQAIAVTATIMSSISLHWNTTPSIGNVAFTVSINSIVLLLVLFSNIDVNEKTTNGCQLPFTCSIKATKGHVVTLAASRTRVNAHTNSSSCWNAFSRGMQYTIKPLSRLSQILAPGLTTYTIILATLSFVDLFEDTNKNTQIAKLMMAAAFMRTLGELYFSRQQNQSPLNRPLLHVKRSGKIMKCLPKYTLDWQTTKNHFSASKLAFKASKLHASLNAGFLIGVQSLFILSFAKVLWLDYVDDYQGSFDIKEIHQHPIVWSTALFATACAAINTWRSYHEVIHKAVLNSAMHPEQTTYHANRICSQPVKRQTRADAELTPSTWKRSKDFVVEVLTAPTMSNS